MSVGAVIVTIRLLAGLYGVDPALMQCIVERESSYNVAAQNGECVGLVQWRPSTRTWLAGKAQEDPLWLHGGAGGTVYEIALAAWAVSEGYGSHWATYEGCGGEG